MEQVTFLTRVMDSILGRTPRRRDAEKYLERVVTELRSVNAKLRGESDILGHAEEGRDLVLDALDDLREQRSSSS